MKQTSLALFTICNYLSKAARFAPQLFKNKISTGGYSAAPSSSSSPSSPSSSPSPTPIIATGEVLAKWRNTNRNARRRLPRVHIDDLFALENAEYLDGMRVCDETQRRSQQTVPAIF